MFLNPQRRAQTSAPDPSELARVAQFIRDARAQLQKYLAEDAVDAALKLYGKMLQADSRCQLEERELTEVIRVLVANKRGAQAAPFLTELIARFPERNENAKLRLAKICVTELNRPERAIEIIQEMGIERLSADHQAVAKRIVGAARNRLEEGDLGLDDLA